ncbi:MAG: hypothetical protein Ct9H300mP23_02200 [Nitrospinota bacterium]|nr:MAG: hypothetical protein Ct9H300mP23_02200 [Nitrospinota bacterium]
MPFILIQPLAFLLFFIAGWLRQTGLHLISEAEQELVAGFHTEYTGMKFAMFFMGEYINMVTMSALVTFCFWVDGILMESQFGRLLDLLSKWFSFYVFLFGCVQRFPKNSL